MPGTNNRLNRKLSENREDPAQREINMRMRHELITWEDVDKLIEHLIPQFDTTFDTMVMITRGGIIPGGLLADALDITHILTAAVDFPAEIEMEEANPPGERSKYVAWPKFMQFPDDNLVKGLRTLVVDDVWGSGRTIMAVKNRVSAAGGFPYTCVLHFNPYRNLFGNVRPDFFAAVTDVFIIYPWEVNRDTNGVFDNRPL